MSKVIAGIFMALALIGFTPNARAITVDGNVSDWFNNSNLGYSSWTPTNAVTTSLNDDGHYFYYAPTAGWDNTNYDIEMAALSLTNNGVYVMFVISDTNVWEDLGIAVNGETNHRFGVDLSGINYLPGVSQSRGVYEVTNWQTQHAGFTGLPQFQILSGNYLGTSQFVFSSLGHGDGPTAIDYVLEGYISFQTLGINPNSICLQFSEISCLRDSVSLCTDTSHQVPEPASMLLFGSGLVGLVRRRMVNI